MNLFLVGLDHTTAPIEIRERLAFSPIDVPAALLQLTQTHDGSEPIFREAVLLSTCNRVELYGLAADGATAERVIEFLAAFHHLDARMFSHTLFFYQGETVARHICATASGLRSLILGEAQIQGQVRTAFEVARNAGSCGPVLGRLFHHAIASGRRVRHETALGNGAASVSQAGVELARRRLGSLQGRTVLLVGSGEVSELAAQNLLSNGADRMIVVNRTLAHAQELASRYGARPCGIEELPHVLSEADIVISSTAAPVPIIYREHIAAAMQARVQQAKPDSDHRMLLIDLAVPRDIASDVASLPGVHVCTVDDLHEVVQHTLDQRQELAEVAERIAAEEVDSFTRWLIAQDAMPILQSLRRRAEELRCAEMSRALRSLNALSPEQQHVVEAMSRALVNKLLHGPTSRLRTAAEQGEGMRYAAMLSDLFNLEEKMESAA